MVVQISKITEETYKAHILNWHKDRTKIAISIVEDGCPPITNICTLDIKGLHTESQARKMEGNEKPTNSISIGHRKRNKNILQVKKTEKKKARIY